MDRVKFNLFDETVDLAKKLYAPKHLNKLQK